MALFQDIVTLLNDHNASDIPFIVGGIIPVEDVPSLKQMDVKEIFPPETPTDEIVDFIKKLIQVYFLITILKNENNIKRLRRAFIIRINTNEGGKI